MPGSSLIDRSGASHSTVSPRSGRIALLPTWLMLGVAAVFTVALTFVSLELPEWLTSLANRWVDIPDYHPAIEPDVIDDFLATSWVRPVGYTALGLVVAAVVVGLALRKRALAVMGAVVLFLPVFGAYATYMFFLAGLGVLRVLWLPVWSGLLALGDVAYLPYMVVVWPLWQAGVDARQPVAYGAIGLGLFLFVLGTAAWLVAGTKGGVVDVSLYRCSRHPQYLGWIVWSWGVMLLSAQQPVVRAGENPGAGLAWVISTLIIVSVAWVEEREMLRRHGAAYQAYRHHTPFLFPIPRIAGGVVTAPLRLITGGDLPTNGRQLAVAFLVYLGIAVLLSLPFAVFDWPPFDWWGWPDFSL